jgi:hypothetical protein
MPGVIQSASLYVESWAIDRYTRELITGEIARRGGMTVIPFEYDYKALWRANYDGPDTNALRAIVKNDLADIARSHNLDTLIIVYKSPQRSVAKPYQTLPFCLYRYYELTGKALTYHILVGIKVLDGKSMETLGSGAFYHKESLEGAFWPPFNDASQLAALEKKTKDILGQKVPVELKELGFRETDE